MSESNLKTALRMVGAVALACGSGCTSTQVTRRFEIEPVGEAETRKDDLTVRCQAVSGDALTNDARLSAEVKLEHVSRPYLTTATWTVVDGFLFNLQIANGLQHILRFGGHAPVEVRLVTAAGDALRPVSKDELKARAEAWLNPQTTPGEWFVHQDSQQTVRGLVENLNVMNLNTEVIPSATTTFYVAFEIPSCRTSQQVEDWLANQDTLTLRLFDVTVETDAAGNATRTTTFEFPFRVKKFEDTWEVSTFGDTRRVSSRPLN